MSAGAPRGLARRRVYLDTSAYLCILLAEEGAGRLEEETSGAELLSSVLLTLEARRNLIRLAREGAIAPDQYEACMELWFHAADPIDRFVTMDASQAQAARELGLPLGA